LTALTLRVFAQFKWANDQRVLLYMLSLLVNLNGSSFLSGSPGWKRSPSIFA
jgi:hypothetical protein